MLYTITHSTFLNISKTEIFVMKVSNTTSVEEFEMLPYSYPNGLAPSALSCSYLNPG